MKKLIIPLVMLLAFVTNEVSAQIVVVKRSVRKVVTAPTRVVVVVPARRVVIAPRAVTIIPQPAYIRPLPVVVCAPIASPPATIIVRKTVTYK